MLLLGSFVLLLLAGCGLPMKLNGSVGVGAQAPTTQPALVPSPEPLHQETATAPSLPPTPIPPATATVTPVPTALPTSVPATATPSPEPPTTTPTPSDVPTIPPTSTYPPPPAAVDVPILMYHYISEIPLDADLYRRDLTVTPERFEAQLQYLKEQGYTAVRLTDIYETLLVGKPLPARPIVLTFDDGYKDAYTHVLPLLQKYGLTGEFFVLATPSHYEAPAYLTWTEMKQMSDMGMSNAGAWKGPCRSHQSA